MKRIQRKRTKGWRMPDGAVYVGRPSRWGNPWSMTDFDGGGDAVELYRLAIERFIAEAPVEDVLRWLPPLHGRDLVCWCPLDQPCHADVLLELANQ